MIKYLDKQGCETLVSHIKELIATGGTGEPALPDPRALKALISECTTIHDTAYTTAQDTPTFHTWMSTTEALQALQAAIDKAQGTVDGYGETVFKQSELDAEQAELQAALETFKSASTEALPDLTEFEALKARVKAVDDTAHVSTDGKDVPFGETWVTAENKATAATAVQTAESAIEAATKQPEVDTACDTLETAVTAYEGSVVTAVADTAALDAAIEKAQKLREGVIVSDGSGLEPDVLYVTEQKTLDDMDAAIEIAQTAKTDSTTQKMLDDATSALNEAIDAFRLLLRYVGSIYGVNFSVFPDPKGKRTESASEFSDPVPFLGNGANPADQCSSPFDEIMPWAGMEIVERAGGTMVSIPRFWYKLEKSGAGIKVQIANSKATEFSLSPAHMDRGDGKGERDIIYVGRYHCDKSYKSTNANAIKNISFEDAVNGCESVGDGYHLMDFAALFTIWLLYIVEFANWDSQASIGEGRSTSQQIYLDNIKYHTGTSASIRSRRNQGFVQYRYIGNLWSNCYSWITGMRTNYLTESNYTDIGIWTELDPTKWMETESGTISAKIVYSHNSGSYHLPIELGVSDSGEYPIFYPLDFSDNSTSNDTQNTTGTCDSWYIKPSSTNTVIPYSGGADTYGGSAIGLFCIWLGEKSRQYENNGARLMELP